MNNAPYCLVKVTDHQWAAKLLDGDIFMRPLSAFGDLISRDSSCSNEFRGNVLEGVSKSFESTEQSQFFSDALGREYQQSTGLGQISEHFLQERILCLYCLESTENKSTFIAPDKRLLDFGDTSVIILDPVAFLRRVCDMLLETYGNSFWVGAKRVEYLVDLTKFAEYDEFTKAASYSWQNEFRIALDLSNGYADQQAWENMTDLCRIMFLNQGGKVDHEAKREPTIIKIGNIRDICVTVPTTDFLDLSFHIDELEANCRRLTPIDPPRRPVVTAFRPIMSD